jgi:hypothetical protein
MTIPAMSPLVRPLLVFPPLGAKDKPETGAEGLTPVLEDVGIPVGVGVFVLA